MKRIDLTEDSMFSERYVPISNIPQSEVVITQTETRNNFLTGTIDDINKKRVSLSFVRSIEGYHPICDRCGKDIVFNKHICLCDKCDKEMDKEFNYNETMKLFSI